MHKPEPVYCVSEIMNLPLLANITLEDIITGLDENHFTSVHLVKAYIARINEVQANFLAVLEVNKDALHIANELDEERQQGRKRGYLFEDIKNNLLQV